MTVERVKYDPQTDTLTLRLGDTPIKESDEITPGLIVDYDANGQIVGVELLNAFKTITASMDIDTLLSRALKGRLNELSPTKVSIEQIADVARKLDTYAWVSYGLSDEFKLVDTEGVAILKELHVLLGGEIESDEKPPKDEQLDELAEKEYLEYLESIGAIREDGTIDRSKIKYKPAQTFEELEDLLDQDE